MPTYIHKYPEAGDRCYLMWSTVVDAPVTYGMTRGELESYYKERHGSEGMRELSARLARADARGTSCQMGDDSPDDDIAVNRAGRGERKLTRADIVEWYCVKRTDPPQGLGERWKDIFEREDAVAGSATTPGEDT